VGSEVIQQKNNQLKIIHNKLKFQLVHLNKKEINQFDSTINQLYFLD